MVGAMRSQIERETKDAEAKAVRAVITAIAYKTGRPIESVRAEIEARLQQQADAQIRYRIESSKAHPLMKAFVIEVIKLEAEARATGKADKYSRDGTAADMRAQWMRDYPKDRKIPSVPAMVKNCARYVKQR